MTFESSVEPAVESADNQPPGDGVHAVAAPVHRPALNVLLGLLLFVLLAGGVYLVYQPQLPAVLGGPVPLQVDAADTYVTDLDFWQRTPREKAVVARANFDLDADLRNVPMQIGAWTGREVAEDNEEVMILLDPEQYIQRLYQDNAGRYIWLTLVGGRSSQPFHAPDICYDADGWQYDLGSHPTTLAGGGDIYGLYLDAQKSVADRPDPKQQVIYYFYLFPDSRRDQSDGIVLFKLTSPRYGSLEETLALHEGFVQELFSKADSSELIATAP